MSLINSVSVLRITNLDSGIFAGRNDHIKHWMERNTCYWASVSDQTVLLWWPWYPIRWITSISWLTTAALHFFLGLGQSCLKIHYLSI